MNPNQFYKRLLKEDNWGVNCLEGLSPENMKQTEEENCSEDYPVGGLCEPYDIWREQEYLRDN